MTTSTRSKTKYPSPTFGLGARARRARPRRSNRTSRPESSGMQKCNLLSKKLGFRPNPIGTYLSESQFRKLQYNATINEITIPSPIIGNHPNITVFVGIGFDVEYLTGQVWLVLVFLQGGDLAMFISSYKAEKEDMLLGICSQVAK